MVSIKAKAFLFETEKDCRIVTKRVKNGRIKIRDKEWPVDKVKNPLMIQVGRIFKKQMRLYFLHHNMATPMEYNFDNESFSAAITPENYSALSEQGTIKQLLTLKGTSTADVMMYMIIGGVVGVLLGVLLGPSIGVGFIG